MENGEQLWFKHLNHGFNYEQMIKHGALTNEIVDLTNTHAENTGFTVTIKNTLKSWWLLTYILTIYIWIWLSTITGWWLTSPDFFGGDLGIIIPCLWLTQKNATTNQHMFLTYKSPYVLPWYLCIEGGCCVFPSSTKYNVLFCLINGLSRNLC